LIYFNAIYPGKQESFVRSDGSQMKRVGNACILLMVWKKIHRMAAQFAAHIIIFISLCDHFKMLVGLGVLPTNTITQWHHLKVLVYNSYLKVFLLGEVNIFEVVTKFEYFLINLFLMPEQGN
jgi:hypothetical protein